MRFTPKTEDQLHDEALLPKGEYFFTVESAEEKVSRSGNDMTVVTLDIWMADVRMASITDYLMEKMGFKLRHFCVATGLESAYNAGELQAHMLLGKSGCCKIEIQGPKDGYPSKNVIRDYIKPSTGSEMPTTTQPQAAQNTPRPDAPPHTDDDLPF